MPHLTIDQATHEYRVDNRPVLGVSKILQAAGLMSDEWLSEEALKRGSYVHEAVLYHLEGSLDEAALDPNLLGYVEAWKKFEQENGFRVLREGDLVSGRIEAEIPRHHPIYGYAGTPDYLGTIEGARERRILIDLKSGEPSDWHAEQLALYAMLFDCASGPRPERWNVYVRADGSYRQVERKNREDFENAKAAITIARLRIARGLVKGRKTS